MIVGMNLQFFWLQKALLAVTFLVYVFWSYRRGKESGFDRSKFLDLVLLSPAVAVLVYGFFAWLGLSSEAFFFLGFLLFSVYFASRENWSYFRIGDVFAESCTLASIFFPHFYNLVFNLISIYVFYVLRKVAAAKARTGFVFLNFLIIFSVYYLSLSMLKERTLVSFNLPLAAVFFLWGLLGLRRKEYRDSLDLLKYSLPGGFLETLRAKLLEKEKGGVGRPGQKEGENADEDQGSTREKEEVRQALQRIQGGDYGLCQICHKPIGVARLEVSPEARLCLNCETQTASDGDEK